VAAAYVELTVAIVHLDERITEIQHHLRWLELKLLRPDLIPGSGRTTRTRHSR
jgi:hypothetical protein